MGGTTIKTIMYADNTTILIRSQTEADLLASILALYSRATGAKINWEKSYLLKVKALRQLMILGARLVTLDTLYKHLGIPIKVEIEAQTEQFWEDMIAKAKRIATLWSRYYLSLKKRVMIANTMVLALARYAVRFLFMPVKLQGRLKKEYYKLIWDQKAQGTIRDLHVCHPRKEGGVDNKNLNTIIKANVTALVARAKAHPQLPWRPLLEEVILGNCKSQPNIRAIQDPWI